MEAPEIKEEIPNFDQFVEHLWALMKKFSATERFVMRALAIIEREEKKLNAIQLQK